MQPRVDRRSSHFHVKLIFSYQIHVWFLWNFRIPKETSISLALWTFQELLFAFSTFSRNSQDAILSYLCQKYLHEFIYHVLILSTACSFSDRQRYGRWIDLKIWKVDRPLKSTAWTSNWVSFIGWCPYFATPKVWRHNCFDYCLLYCRKRGTITQLLSFIFSRQTLTKPSVAIFFNLRSLGTFQTDPYHPTSIQPPVFQYTNVFYKLTQVSTRNKVEARGLLEFWVPEVKVDNDLRFCSDHGC
jgi:hypothetical protein